MRELLRKRAPGSFGTVELINHVISCVFRIEQRVLLGLSSSSIDSIRLLIETN